MDKKRNIHQQSHVETTPRIGLCDSEIIGTPKNQQKDKKQWKNVGFKLLVDQDALLKPMKLQKHKLRKKKVVTTPEIVVDDLEILETTKNQQKGKKRGKKQRKVEITNEPPLEVESNKNLKKIIDGLSDRLNEMTEIVQKLKKTSDLLDKEKETPEEKVFECLYESKEAFIEHKRSIFVRGFDCSFPRDEIRSTLIKHFSSCGEVCEVAIPFHCKTGSPMGFAFINMVKDEEKALTLDGSYLGGMRLEVTMAINRSEYHGYTGRLGCNRCRRVLLKRRMEDFYSFPTILIPSPEINRSSG
ncbi:polyadenylate-binding protein 2-like isoform X2 [Raphanus sativus]|nr:polyadenylate-binding protein 2-like isoform X2 [Raphanus sativus]